MVAVACTHPSHTARFCFLDRDVGGAAHHKVAHSVVAIEQRRGRMILNRADPRLCVDPTALDTFHVLRQAKDAMAVSTAGVGLRRQLGHNARVRGGKTHVYQNPRDELTKIGYAFFHRVKICQVTFTVLSSQSIIKRVSLKTLANRRKDDVIP
jgi:hypothetical protein